MVKIWSGGASKEGGIDLSDVMTSEDVKIDSILLDYELTSLIAYHLQLRNESIIPLKDSDSILAELVSMLGKKTKLDPALEDVHGFVENYLKKKGGNAYKNLRVFLSRNEQSHTNIRSFYIDHLLRVSKNLISISELMHVRKGKSKGEMPGYTHNQQAMPVTVSSYFDYLSRTFLDMSLEAIKQCDELMETSPLGYGSGFGSLSPVDFNAIAKNLGFKSKTRNPMAGAFHRGFDDLNVSVFLLKVMVLLSRISQDFIIFSSGKSPFATLPSGFTTGSSLMPNKKNPDFLEMVQGYASEAVGRLVSTSGILLNKHSGYHREFQISKDGTIEYMILAEKLLDHFRAFLLKVGLDEEKARESMENSVNATAEAYSIFKSGKSWKDSYALAGEKVRRGIPLDYHRPQEYDSVSNTDILLAKRERGKILRSWSKPRKETINKAKLIISGSRAGGRQSKGRYA